jgi:hypothetical protein
MPSHDDLEEGVRARLRELFEVWETARQSAAAGSGEPTEQATALRVLGTHLYPALDRRVTDTAGSSAMTWHLAHMACDVVDSVRLRGPAFQSVRDANKRLKSALTTARRIQELEVAEDLEELKALIPQVAPDVLNSLQPTLRDQHGETMGKLDDLATSVHQVTPDVVTPLETMLQHYEHESGEELEELEHLLKELPQRLSDALIKSLPAAVAAIVAALKPQPALPSTPVIIPVTFPNLGALAAAQASDYTTSAGERIVFLQAALTTLQSAIHNNQRPAPGQLSQITNVVVAVINYIDTALAPTDLYTITSYKQQFVSVLNDPVLTGGN